MCQLEGRINNQILGVKGLRPCGSLEVVSNSMCTCKAKGHKNLCPHDFLLLQVITLLLCGATQCDNVAVFVDQITKMDVEDQFSFKFLIESVFTDMEQGCLTAESFANILSKQGELYMNVALQGLK